MMPIRCCCCCCAFQVDQIIPPESPLVKLLEWLMERLQPGAVLQPPLPIPGMPRGFMDGLGAEQQPDAL
jgi:hypothetical protein